MSTTTRATRARSGGDGGSAHRADEGAAAGWGGRGSADSGGSALATGAGDDDKEGEKEEQRITRRRPERCWNRGLGWAGRPARRGGAGRGAWLAEGGQKGGLDGEEGGGRRGDQWPDPSGGDDRAPGFHHAEIAGAARAECYHVDGAHHQRRAVCCARGHGPAWPILPPRKRKLCVDV